MRHFVQRLKVMAVMGIVAVALSGCVYAQYRILHDCGWFGLLKGSEWLWLFGACHHGITP